MRGGKIPARLRALEGAWRGALHESAAEAARRCMDAAMALAPEGSGRRREKRLKSSFSSEIRWEGDSAVGVARVDNPHAAYVEFGTGRRGAATGSGLSYDGDWAGMAARPYMQTAADMEREAFLRDAAARIRRSTGG